MESADGQLQTTRSKEWPRRAFIVGAGVAILAGTGAGWSAGVLPEPDLSDVLPDSNLLPAVDDAALPAGARQAAGQVFDQVHRIAVRDYKATEQQVFFLDNLPGGVGECRADGSTCDPTAVLDKYQSSSYLLLFSMADKLENYGYRRPNGLARTYAVKSSPGERLVDATPFYFSPRWGDRARFGVVELTPSSGGAGESDGGQYGPSVQSAQAVRGQMARGARERGSIRAFQERYGVYGVYGFFKFEPI